MLDRRTLLKSSAAFGAVAMAGPALAASHGKLKVVASFSVLGDMVSRIGGSHVSVTTLVGPNGDTHVYQPGPTAAKAVSQAKLVVVNGLGFEGWLDRLVEAAEFKGVRVIATDGITPLPSEGGHHDDGHEGEKSHEGHDDHGKKAGHEDHDHGHRKKADHAGHEGHDDHKEEAGHKDHHGHDHGAFDPHAWHSLTHAVTYVDNITAALSKADPANAGAYYQNRSAYVAEIKALSAELRKRVEALPEASRTVVTPHDGFGYLADAYGLRFVAPQGLSTESEVSAADVARLIRLIRKEKIKAVFMENVADTRLIKQIANETGATVGGSLYSDALSEPTGPAGTYLDMMRHNITTLTQALSS